MSGHIVQLWSVRRASVCTSPCLLLLPPRSQLAHSAALPQTSYCQGKTLHTCGTGLRCNFNEQAIGCEPVQSDPQPTNPCEDSAHDQCLTEVGAGGSCGRLAERPCGAFMGRAGTRRAGAPAPSLVLLLRRQHNHSSPILLPRRRHPTAKARPCTPAALACAATSTKKTLAASQWSRAKTVVIDIHARVAWPPSTSPPSPDFTRPYFTGLD